MPIKTIYMEDGLGITYHAYDLVTGNEVINANEEAYSRKDFPERRYKIVDRTDCTEYRVGASEVKKIAEQEKDGAKINPDFIVALVSKTDHQFGMTRMYHAYMNDEGFISESFEDQESAMQWINKKIKKSE